MLFTASWDSLISCLPCLPAFTLSNQPAQCVVNNNTSQNHLWPLLRFMCVYNIDEFTKSPLWQYFIEQHSIPQVCIVTIHSWALRYIVFLLTDIIITVTWWHDCTRLKRFESVNNEWHKSLTHYNVLAHTCTKTHMAHLCIDYSCFRDLRDFTYNQLRQRLRWL